MVLDKIIESTALKIFIIPMFDTEFNWYDLVHIYMLSFVTVTTIKYKKKKKRLVTLAAYL